MRINLTLPRKELIVNRNAEEDLYVSIRDAFDDMARQVEEVMRMREGQIKSHPNYCRVKSSVFSKTDDFGFIATPNGDKFYFNGSNVVNHSFDKLEKTMVLRSIE